MTQGSDILPKYVYLLVPVKYYKNKQNLKVISNLHFIKFLVFLKLTGVIRQDGYAVCGGFLP